MFDLNRIPQLKLYIDEAQRLLNSGYAEQSANTLRKSFEIVMHLLSLTHIKIFKGKHYNDVKYYETKLNVSTLYNNGIISKDDYNLLDFISRVTNQASHANGTRKIIDFSSKRDIDKYRTDVKYYVEFVKRKLDSVPDYLIKESREFTEPKKKQSTAQQNKKKQSVAKQQAKQDNQQQAKQDNQQQAKQKNQQQSQPTQKQNQQTQQQQFQQQQKNQQPQQHSQKNQPQPQQEQQPSKSKKKKSKQQSAQQQDNQLIQQQSQSSDDYDSLTDYDYDDEYAGSIRQSISNVFNNILDAIEPRVSNKTEVSNRPIEIIINGYKSYALFVIGKIYGTPEIDKKVLSTLKKYTKPTYDCYVSFKRLSASIYFKDFNKIVNKASPNSPVICEITAVLYSESKIKLDLLRTKILTTKSIHCDIRQNGCYEAIDNICLTGVIPYKP